jgi:hypothetical protein
LLFSLSHIDLSLDMARVSVSQVENDTESLDRQPSVDTLTIEPITVTKLGLFTTKHLN